MCPAAPLEHPFMAGCFAVPCLLHLAHQYSVAAYTYRGGGSHPGLALWQPGMTSWYLCRSSQINSFSGDLAFYQGKLYMVWMYTADISLLLSLGRTSTDSVCLVLSIMRLIHLSIPGP